MKRNMKGKMMSYFDRLMLRKRAIIESVNYELKNIGQLVHTSYCSKLNWLINLLSGLVVYISYLKNLLYDLIKIRCKFDTFLKLYQIHSN